MRIGDLAKRAGVTPKTIRFYEQSGLLRRAARTSAGYREYATDTIDEVLLIRKAQALGFSLEDVREILELARAGRAPCSRVLDLARRHVADIEAKITLLQRLNGQLNEAVARWQDGGEPEDCAESFCGLIQNVGAETGEEDTSARKPLRVSHSRLQTSPRVKRKGAVLGIRTPGTISQAAVRKSR